VQFEEDECYDWKKPSAETTTKWSEMMNTVRKIKKVWKSRPTIEGAGVHLKRGFGNYEVPQLDPFLLLDDFRSENPAHYLKGFPWHPTGALRRSLMSSPVKLNMGQSWKRRNHTSR